MGERVLISAGWYKVMDVRTITRRQTIGLIPKSQTFS